MLSETRNNGGSKLTGETSRERLGLWYADGCRPAKFQKSSLLADHSDDDESTVGKMPPSDPEDES